MKKIKYIVLITLLVVLCGCTAKETVVMDEYGKVTQKVVIPLETGNMSKDEYTSYAKNLLKSYDKALSYRKYKTNIIYGEKVGNLVFTNSFDNICSYIEKTVFSQYIYKIVRCNEDEEFIEIKNETSHIPYCSDCSSWPSFDDIKYSIKLPVAAEESDADEIKNNVYTWKFDKNTDDNKSFYLKISKKALEENLEKLNKKNKLNKFIIILSVVIIIIIIGLIINLLYKKYKSNRLEY